MESRAVTLLEELRALVYSRRLVEREISSAVGQALLCGEDRSAIAFALGVSRATLYRQYGALMGEES